MIQVAHFLLPTSEGPDGVSPRSFRLLGRFWELFFKGAKKISRVRMVVFFLCFWFANGKLVGDMKQPNLKNMLVKMGASSRSSSQNRGEH